MSETLNQHLLVLDTKEVRALYEMFAREWISHENELAYQTVQKIIKFVQEHDALAKKDNQGT